MKNFNLIIEVFRNVAPLSVALGRALTSSIELSFLSLANLVLRILGSLASGQSPGETMGNCSVFQTFKTPQIKVLFKKKKERDYLMVPWLVV